MFVPRTVSVSQRTLGLSAAQYGGVLLRPRPLLAKPCNQNLHALRPRSSTAATIQWSHAQERFQQVRPFAFTPPPPQQDAAAPTQEGAATSTSSSSWSRTASQMKDEVHFMDRMKKNSQLVSEEYQYDSQKYMLPMVNHIWEQEEIEERMRTAKEKMHQPQTTSDKVLHFLVKKVMYRGFNRITGFDYNDPSPRACAYRLIILESIAGVPGMVAAVLRHFTSLRTLRRDHGWIHTLLEEAQNERMHLLVCLKMFDAGIATRIVVTLAQYVMVTVLTATYIIKPKLLHRFVGYLEETACDTYADLVLHTRREGSKLNRAWKDVPASDLARQYWNLPKAAKWVDVLEQLLADESHHRDVNHTFADIDAEECNPFVEKHIRDLEDLWERREALGWKSGGDGVGKK